MNSSINSEINPNCFLLKSFGILNLLTSTLIIIFNSIIIYNYNYNKNLHKIIFNQFVISLSLVQLIGTLIELPFSVLNQLHCHWIFQPILSTCIFTTFIQTFTSQSCIYLLTAITFDKYFQTKYLFLKKQTDNSLIKKIICICYSLACIHSILPFAELSTTQFQVNNALNQCESSYNTSRSLYSFVYLTILINVYILPSAVICAFTYETMILMRKTIVPTSNNIYLNIFIRK